MDTLGASLSMLGNQGIIIYLLKGVAFTLLISVISVLAGLVWGSILALVRNYCVGGKGVGKVVRRIFRFLATAYIEIFRNTPLLLWIFICLVFCPVPKYFSTHQIFGLTTANGSLLFRACIALILFTSSVIAEIVRGGLNGVAFGQFEAAHSQGFNTVQTMWYIILPQAYRNIIPTLLSQVITTIKDSSYLANVAVIELMARTRQMMNSAYMYNGTGTVNVSDVFVMFGAAAVIYFIINFTLSCVVRTMQKRQKKRPAVVVNADT